MTVYAEWRYFLCFMVFDSNLLLMGFCAGPPLLTRLPQLVSHDIESRAGPQLMCTIDHAYAFLTGQSRQSARGKALVEPLQSFSLTAPEYSTVDPPPLLLRSAKSRTASESRSMRGPPLPGQNAPSNRSTTHNPRCLQRCVSESFHRHGNGLPRQLPSGCCAGR
jgi:hypothetical protein